MGGVNRDTKYPEADAIRETGSAPIPITVKQPSRSHSLNASGEPSPLYAVTRAYAMGFPEWSSTLPETEFFPLSRFAVTSTSDSQLGIEIPSIRFRRNRSQR